MVARIESFVAECFCPGVSRAELEELDSRIDAAIAELHRQQRPIRYLGSILMQEDEVVLCQFEGPADVVREAAERAEIPFERILETARSPWLPQAAPHQRERH
jgi:hypothetical protein